MKFKLNERVEPKRQRQGEYTSGVIQSFDRDCFGQRAALVHWDSGGFNACTRLELTSDLRRPRPHRTDCHCCGELASCKPGRYVVGDRAFDGAVCKACRTCEDCGKEFEVTDNAEISCGCGTRRAPQNGRQ